MLNAVSAQTPYLHALMPNPHRAIERILRLYIRLALRRKTTGAPRRRAIQLNGIQPRPGARPRRPPGMDIGAGRAHTPNWPGPLSGRGALHFCEFSARF